MAIKNMTAPDFGSATDVTVIEILVKPGDHIQAEMPIMTLESDKATMELPAIDEGIVKAINVEVGEKVATGAVLLSFESEESKKEQSSRATPPSSQPQPSQSKQIEPSQEQAAASSSPRAHVAQSSVESVELETTSTDQQSDAVHAGPGVRRLAREFGVDLIQVQGSGPKSRILKEDVQRFVKQRLSQPLASGPLLDAMPAIDFAQFGPIEMHSLSRIKKISGKHLARNWISIPHVTQFGEADITELEAFRQAQKPEVEKQHIKLTPLVFIMKAVVACLKAFPMFNASLDQNGEQVVLKKYFHLGIAVDTPEGLVVPVIRDVDKKGLLTLSKELAQVSEKARKKQLMPDEMKGGCFSISSLGGIGGTAFTPIINSPEVAILGVSKSRYQPVYQDGTFIPRLMLPLALSFDHRVIDGADGARFIVKLIQMLSDIRNLLM